MSQRRSFVLAGSFLLLAASAAGVARAQQAPLTFGVLNQQSAALTAERWNPILHYVTTASGDPPLSSASVVRSRRR